MNGSQPVPYYTTAIDELSAIRSAVGITDLSSHRGRLRITGPDRASYLHRILSNEVEGLSTGDGNYNLILTNRGKIIADMKLTVSKDEIDLSTISLEAKDLLYSQLDKYLIADDVTITDITRTTGMISVNGPQATPVVESILACPVASLREYHNIVRQIHISPSIAQEWVMCVRANETGQVGYNLFVEKTDVLPQLWQILLDKGQKYQIQPVGLSALEALRIEAGIPKLGAELDESIIPLEAELDHGINFEKGCYIGQEIVARMRYRGHPNRLLRGFEVESDLPLKYGDRIFDQQKEIGRITSSTKSISFGKTLAMGYIRTAYTDQGTTVEVETDTGQLKLGRQTARVVLLPFEATLPLALPH